MQVSHSLSIEFWFVAFGCLLVLMALVGSVLKRMPFSSALIYLGLGYGGAKLGFATIVPHQSAAALEHLSEIAVVISLFCSGLKLRLPLTKKAWRLPLRLATVGMVATIAFLTMLGLLLGFTLGAAILLAAILAPTDPVLASEVQVAHPTDTDRLRFGLTGEAGLNDGAAFPFVMLGLGVLGQHEVGRFFARWVTIDVFWAVVVGLGIGWGLGTMIGKLVLYLRRAHREAVGLDDFLALGLIALSYGASVLVHGYGFLAVFAAGLALRRVESMGRESEPPADLVSLVENSNNSEVATNPDTAPAYMANAVLGFTEQMERVGEVVLMLLVGAMLAQVGFSMHGFGVAAFLMFVARPLAIMLATFRSRSSLTQRVLIAWFGVRGIGSIYYLFFALNHGASGELATHLVPLVLTVVACSAVLHGTSVTPLMRWYERYRRPNVQTGQPE